MMREPVFNLSAPVTFLGAMFIFIHALTFIAPEIHHELLVQFSFIPAEKLFPGSVTYLFLHADWGHVFMNTVMLAAFGAPFARRFGFIRFMAFVFVTAFAGAMMQYVASLQMIFMVGASAVTSGLFAACLRLPAFGQGDYIYASALSLRFVLTSSQHLTIIAVWLITNYIFAAGLATNDGVMIAWQAHIGGFLAGLLLFTLFDKKP
jgi:membrane associated rhomboid family serine protease